ncbi:MAG: hypothetical protein K2P88_00970 [Chitinophagaceae bacterium]|nr:hypothetical protein [Chitinophagaceae bacterium]
MDEKPHRSGIKTKEAQRFEFFAAFSLRSLRWFLSLSKDAAVKKGSGLKD